MVIQDDRLITLNLLNLEIVGSFIAIIGLAIFILTSMEAKTILLTPSYHSNRYVQPSASLDEAALVGRILLVTAGFLAAYTTTIRLLQLAHRQPTNKPWGGALTPNIWLTIGSWTVLAGGLMAFVGDYLRLQQSPRLPIQ